MKRKLRLLAIPARYFTLSIILLLFAFCANAQKQVSGVVKSATGPVAGATVAVKGASVATQTATDGTFSLTVPAGKSVLVISYVGLETREVDVSSQSSVDLTLAAVISSLNEVVVTGYSTQRKKDIIGAVSVIDSKELKQTAASNLAVQLQGRAAGVVVTSTGAPGAAAIVRIRGFQSFGNNNPLYIIDGVPTGDPSLLNPMDVSSVQILKDASSASIYGTRAANGVVIVTTKQGRPGRATVTYEGYVGVQKISDEMKPDLLNNQRYVEYLERSSAAGTTLRVFGTQGAFKLPANIIVSDAFKGGVPAGDPRADPAKYNIDPTKPFYQILATTPEGSNWFDEITRTGLIQSHQITASGGTEKALYTFGANYFEQEGTFKFTNYKRYTARLNTAFKPVNWLRFGENLQVSYEDRLGNDQRNEGGAWSSAFRMVPYIPVYDINGGWGGNGVGESGNGNNPVAFLYRQKDNKNLLNKIFGNFFAEALIGDFLTARTSFGIDNGSQFEKIINYKTYERSENQAATDLREQGYTYINWTWTNTLNYQKVFATNHDVKLMVGTEAIRNKSRGSGGTGVGFDFDDPGFISLNTSGIPGRTTYTYNLGETAIYSIFGRLDYAFKGKYLLSATMRRDGASVFGPEERYANFPSVGVGWRVSEENFMKSVTWISDLKLRAGWGKVGAISNVSATNAYSTFASNVNVNYYDITGSNNSSTQGYGGSTLGNPSTKWEATEAANLGLDLTLKNGKWDFVVDVYRNDTKDLLIPRVRNSLEPNLGQPRINIGKMRNTGYEFSVNNRGTIFSSDLKYVASVNFSHYKNELVYTNEEGSVFNQSLDRLSNALVTKAGYPVSSFIGYNIIGFYNTADDVAKGSKINGQPGQVGTWMYEDINKDGNITVDDRTILGDPHPDFQMGFNLNLTYKSFDFTGFLFWNQGGELYNYTKYYTDMRVFVGGVSPRVLDDSWTPSHTDAKLPRLSGNPAENGFTSFVLGNSNSYYVEDGSYLRLKTLQIGYTLPKSLIDKAKM
ncbi:MAG TPA: SusC/RagA family TonB-linked outer membrane protein, partial [Chitinophagaceae bacterium]|nr:SusC/RagA family TonB-linked outer membrane protein [Chitinophagaceae bacterium]